MASEIERIACATDFNGIKLLDGSLNGEHDGSGLNSTGAIKVHFGRGNDASEDYCYVDIGDATLAGLGLRDDLTNGGGSTDGVRITWEGTLADSGMQISPVNIPPLLPWRDLPQANNGNAYYVDTMQNLFHQGIWNGASGAPWPGNI